MDKSKQLTIGSIESFAPTSQYSPGITRASLPESASSPDQRRFNRVLLVNPPATLYRNDFPRCTYPLGLGYIAAVLEQYGYVVKILDTFAEGYHLQSPVEGDQNFVRYGLPDEAVEEFIRDFDPDIFGVSSIFSNQADNVHHLLKMAKGIKPSVITAIGGAHPRYFPKACLSDPNLDLVCLGEAELTFLQYLEYLNSHFDLEEIQGIAFRDGNSIRINSENILLGTRAKKDQEFRAELDQIPFPAWHLYNMERYFELRAYQSPYTIGDRVGQIYTSRGCSAHCTFCTTTNFWGNRLRRRSPQNVLEEISTLKERYHINEFHVQDDNITNDMKHAKHLFRAFKELSLPWATPQGTALWRMDEELLELMAGSGAYQITFAIESGVQRVLNELIRKPLDLSRTKHLIRYAQQLGIHIHGFFIIGMPPMFGCEGETLEEMLATFHFAQEAGFNSASFFTATPIIGSELLSECLRQGFVDPAIKLYQMSYKQGLINIPGLWSGVQVAELAAKFNYEFNANDSRSYTPVHWNPQQY